MMVTFGNQPQQAPQVSLVDQILQMRQQGYTNNQIVQTLQRYGYKSAQIFDAMNQADLKGGIEEAPQEEYAQAYPEQPMAMQPTSQVPQQAQQQPMAADTSTESIEEIAEAIIEEKWTDLLKDVNKIIEWKDKAETRLVKIEQEFTDLKSNFDNLHKGVLGKISEYDQGLSNVGTEIKALEKVFQKILPTLTENVNELSRITTDLKKKK